MLIRIEDANIPASLVTTNQGLNYGRFDHWHSPVLQYVVHFPRAKFVRLLAENYRDLIVELGQDDEIVSETCDLAQAGWPTLHELLAMHKLAIDTLETYLDRDTFAAFGLVSQHAEYVINSTDAIDIDDTDVIYTGRCIHTTIL